MSSPLALLINLANVSQPFRLLQKINAPKPAFAVSMAKLTTTFVTGFWSSLNPDLLAHRIGVIRDLNFLMTSSAEETVA